MHYFLAGENWYGREGALRELLSGAGMVETPDLESVTTGDLRVLVGSQSLFSEKKTVILKNPSQVTEIWAELDKIVAAASADVTVVVVEDKPDKRTKMYKILASELELREFPLWTPHDRGFATEWLIQHAKSAGLLMRPREAGFLIDRVGVHQADLAAALDKLVLAGSAETEMIERVIDVSPSENVFGLFEAALAGDSRRIARMLSVLRQTEEPYRVFGLLTAQLMPFTTLLAGDASTAQVANDLGVKPFVLTKLSGFARGYGAAEARRLIELAAVTDLSMKSTTVEPWLLVEQFLQKITLR